MLKMIVSYKKAQRPAHVPLSKKVNNQLAIAAMKSQNIKQKRVYIAGKISGQPIHITTMNFGEAQKKLEEKGYEVVNPLAVVNDWHCTWEEAMKKCIPALLECDAIHLLPDWDRSKGAILERYIADAIGLEFIGSVSGLTV